MPAPVTLPRVFAPAGRAARAANWTITRTGKNHLKWKPPAGEFVITPSTPSDARGIKNALIKLRNAGLTI